jgi:electron transport complex protein RnfG
MQDLKPILWRTTSRLTLFALVGAILIVGSYHSTRQQIVHNEKMTLLQTLNGLIPPNSYDNDLVNDSIEMENRAFLGSAKPMTIYRARKQKQAVAAIINSIAPDGYSGNIYLVVAVNYDGTLAGVRVLSHQETPGLGDYVEERRSKWILGFNQRSLNNPEEAGWKVKRDGGVFDQFTGATITPRAVVKAVYKTLLFYQQYRDTIFMEKTAN